MAKETLATQFSPAQISVRACRALRHDWLLTQRPEQVVELDHAENESDIQNALATRLGRSKVTVPQVRNFSLVTSCYSH